ncbi:MAG: GNAT family N-acetyltransferase [Propioniciclava sp.]|uniref:GNAT family N-acetyltransferase n=1 Tax=Propioniciclava sp. TaxID=2038686 RepID=UPI0039E3B0F2
MDPRLAHYFPPLGVRVASGRLELRGIGTDEVLALIDVVRDGVHDPAQMPFSFPWTDASREEIPRNYLQWWWRELATWTPEAWNLNLCVLWDGEVVGVQSVATRDFPTVRYGETGSWLGRRFHGRGIGTAMRQAMCAFLFDELDFEFITSSAVLDNAASLRISEKLGYVDNGVDWSVPRKERVSVRRLLLLPEDFRRGDPITVEGADALRRFLGVRV